MKEISLTQGMVAIVDDDDYEWLSQWKWYANRVRYTFYAARNIWKNGKNIPVRMHREILHLTPGDKNIVDHKNQNGLDNRKENLRIATPALNGCNCKMNKKNTSGYRGVRWEGRCKKWVAEIKVNGKLKYLGVYINSKDAAKAYDLAALKYRKENALLNLPTNNYNSDCL
jgi:hypothetical protein